MADNNASEEIFVLIANAESNFGVPNDMLRQIYELEESAVHLRNRRIKEKICDVISNIIEITDNSKSQGPATKSAIT